jgi:hypothetical protein
MDLLELMMYNVMKTRPLADEYLHDYCTTFDLTGSPLECQALVGIQLSHLCSLYELIEDIVADAIIPTTPDRYCQKLDNVEMVVNRACEVLGRCTQQGSTAQQSIQTGAHLLEPTLKRFICRHLNEDGPDASWPLAPDVCTRYFSWPSDIVHQRRRK